jgi:peptidylprolyl isomerase
MRIHVLVLGLAATPLLAQTSSTRPATHSTAATHHAAAASTAGGCIKVPEFSPKIPALPPGSPCPKALYTITQRPSFMMDYASPLVSPVTREVIDVKPQTFSLGYVDTEVGSGPLAEPHKWYTVHYTGYLLDGTKFDSSVDRGEPISFPYGAHRVIEGWDTGFEGMHVGGKRRLFVPYQLAYGENGRQGIPPRAELVFDVQLIAQSDAQPKPATPPAAAHPEPNGATPHAVTGHSDGANSGTEPGATSPAGSTATPPVNSTTPAGSTQPPQPATTPQPKK